MSRRVRRVPDRAWDAEAWTSLRACCEEATAASARLLAEQPDLKRAVAGGAAIVGQSPRVACYDPEGRFDRVECTLRLNRLGGPRFLIRTDLYRGRRLVASVSQAGSVVAP